MSGHRFLKDHCRTTRSTHSDVSPAGTRWVGPALFAAAAALIVAPDTAFAQPFWGWGGGPVYIERAPAPAPRRAPKPKKKNDPAEARARAAPKPQGPLVIAVSINKQRVKVYDSNGLFAESPVSTGTKSHPTPAGVFSIIQKNRHHVSNLYFAEMPYMQRLTWSGVAMHTGALPGYAASHGCIRLPNEFAARLWTWTKMGTRVIVTHGEVSPADISHAKLIARMTPAENISAAPDVRRTASLVPSSRRDAMAQVRTADVADTIAKIEGTLSDARSAPMSDTAAEAQKAVVAQAELLNVGIDSAGDGSSQQSAPAVSPSSAKAAADTKSADAKSTEPETIAKPADIVEPANASRPAGTALRASADTAKPAVATKRSQSHVAVFISRKDRKLYVRQGFEPLFDVPVEITDVGRPLGTHVFTARSEGGEDKALSWSVVSIPQSVRPAEPKSASRNRTKAATTDQPVLPMPSAAEALDRIAIPADAQEKIAAIISPGGSILISDFGTGWETGRGTDFIVPVR